MKMINDIFNFLPITDSLSTSGQPTEAQLSALAEEKYELIINLALHDDPRYSLKDETSYVKSLGIKYIHIPVQFDKPLKNDLVLFCDALAANRNKKIHIHCAANMRVTAFLGLYFLIRERKSKKEAFKPMCQIWKPDSVWSSFIDSMIVEFSN
jgi:protein tyrosine phosphatase (PTP) superfamily phosphohydrolase (DUF442 family)